MFAIANNDLLVAIDLRTGQRIWERQIGGSNQPVVSGKYLFLLTNDNRLMAVQADSGKVVWDTKIIDDSSSEASLILTGPLLINNQLTVMSSNGYIFFVSPYNGKTIKTIQIDEGASLPMIIANSQIVITTNEANIITYK